MSKTVDLVEPDPFPPGILPPPPGGGEPQGDWFFKILSLKLMTLYIVTRCKNKLCKSDIMSKLFNIVKR